MKKTIAKAVSAFMALAVLCTSFAGCEQKLDNLSYEAANGEITITSYKDKTTVKELVIPDEIDDMPVTVIGEFGVMNSETLQKITIGKNVKEIGGWAFSSDTALKEFVVDPENQYFVSVDGVLYTKDMKTLVYFPAGKEVETGVYTVPDGVETLRTKCFYKCSNIKEVILPDSVKDIQEKTFHKCENLEKLTFSENTELEHIGKDAFAYCTGLKSFTVPACVKAIDEYAFYNCTNLLDFKVLPKEGDMTLGKKWFPTNNGRDIEGFKINWQ